MQKLPAYFIPSCVFSVDGIRALSICELKPPGLMMPLSFSVSSNSQVCDFYNYHKLLFAEVEPVDSHSNTQRMSLIIRMLQQSLDAATETCSMRHIISHEILELNTPVMPTKI